MLSKCHEEGATGVVCINLSIALSATGQAAQLAADGVNELIDVACVDSMSVLEDWTIIRKTAEAANGRLQ